MADQEWKRGFRVTREAMRPASKEERCFYCGQPIGELHKETCVLVNRLVRVRATIDYVVEVPASWDAHSIEFRYNESSWCADNIVEDLDRWRAAQEEAGHGCMCRDVEVEYVGEFADGTPYRDENGSPLQSEAAMDLIRRGLAILNGDEHQDPSTPVPERIDIQEAMRRVIDSFETRLRPTLLPPPDNLCEP